MLAKDDNKLKIDEDNGKNKGRQIKNLINIFDKKESIVDSKFDSIYHRQRAVSFGKRQLSSEISQRTLIKTNNSLTIESEHSKEEYISYIEIPEKVKNKSFCEAFFISSFSQDKGKVEEDTESFQSTCKHKLCSSFPAMQPEIIYRYPDKSISDLELNNLAASICFPTGIKICYNESPPKKTPESYSSSITDQSGNRYYLMTYHFYYKILNAEFVATYSMYPIKYKTMKFCHGFYEKTVDDTSDYQKEISKKLEEYGELMFHETIYIPYCLCLISKYPYFSEMESCLENIFYSIQNDETELSEPKKLLKYIVRGIPLPQKNSKVKFILPNNDNVVEIQAPYCEDLCLINDNSFKLLSLFSVENIILIFRLLLFEQKILFVDSEYKRLNKISFEFISLLYPFQ